MLYPNKQGQKDKNNWPKLCITSLCKLKPQQKCTGAYKKLDVQVKQTFSRKLQICILLFDLLFLIPGDFIKRQLQCHSIGYLKEQSQSVNLLQ